MRASEHLESWLAHGNPSVEAFDEGRHRWRCLQAEAGPRRAMDQLVDVSTIAVRVQACRHASRRAGESSSRPVSTDIAGAGVLRVDAHPCRDPG